MVEARKKADRHVRWRAKAELLKQFDEDVGGNGPMTEKGLSSANGSHSRYASFL